MANIKKVTGRINGMEISRYIDFYNPEHPEQILTTEHEIRDEFEGLGYNRDLVVFDNE